jgi:hypothetical protein
MKNKFVIAFIVAIIPIWQGIIKKNVFCQGNILQNVVRKVRTSENALFQWPFSGFDIVSVKGKISALYANGITLFTELIISAFHW